MSDDLESGSGGPGSVDLDDRILEVLAEGPASSTQVAGRLGVSRQTAHARLRRLVEAGRIARAGQARATRYALRDGDREEGPRRVGDAALASFAATPAWERRFALDGLDEDRVFEAMATEVEALDGLDAEARSLVAYVVTEIVNNAIDHSAGTAVRVTAATRGSRLRIGIEDDGIGAFVRVREALGLPSDLAALQALSKGKTTTDPDRHTGEGLFFSSKAVDLFRLESGGLAWIVDNERDDMAVEVVDPPRRGTRVVVELDLEQVRSLRALFDAYTEDFELSKTRTVIRLFAIGVRFVSRSEAKRLVHGLERFREVVLDFRGVEGVGQGFADEVFRVWARAHPEVRLVPVRMNEAVEFMVERARRQT